MSRTRVLWPLAAIAGVIAVVAGSGSAILAGRGAAYALAIGSLIVLTGWSGQLNLHVAAIGLGWGAYAAVALAVHGVPVLAAIVLAPVVVVPAALLVGVVAVRFRGLELAIATLAAGLAFEQMAFQSLGKWLGHSTHGSAFESSLVSIARPGGFGGDRAYAVLALAIAAAWLGALVLLARGRAGRTITVVRDREIVAEARGVPVFGWRVGAFALSIAAAAAGGALLAGQTGAVTPDSFNFTLSLQLLAVATLAGIKRLDGAVIGAAIVILAQEAGGLPVLRLISGDRAGLVFGAGLIVVLALQARRRALVAPVADAAVATVAPAEGAAPRRIFPPTVLRVEGVRVAFGGRVVLDGVDLRVGQGEVVGLVGGNGAGKTTLFNCITGLVQPGDGRVFFDGADVTETAPHRRAQRGLARTFQGVEVFGELTVEDGMLVAAGLRATDATRTHVRDVLAMVGMQHAAGADPRALPFAGRRLVELAMAVVAEPALVLLDEPLAGLDAVERAVVLAAIERLRAGGHAVLIVEHDREAVGSIADRVYELTGGLAVERVAPATSGEGARAAGAPAHRAGASARRARGGRVASRR